METILYVTPKDPDFLPASKDQSVAKQYVKRWQHRTYVDEYPARFESSDNQRYFGAFPDYLTCSKCNAVFHTGSENWSSELRERVSTSKDARNELVVMPCCGAQLKSGQLSLESCREQSTLPKNNGEAAMFGYNVSSPYEPLAPYKALSLYNARFSRFAIYIREAHTIFSEKELKKLSDLLKCELIQFTEGWT